MIETNGFGGVYLSGVDLLGFNGLRNMSRKSCYLTLVGKNTTKQWLLCHYNRSRNIIALVLMAVW